MITRHGFKCAGLYQHVAHADGRRHEKHRKIIQALHVFLIENANPGDACEQADADADDGGGNVMKQIGHPQSDGQQHQEERSFFHGAPRAHVLEFGVKKFGPTLKCGILRRVHPNHQAPDSEDGYDRARKKSHKPQAVVHMNVSAIFDQAPAQYAGRPGDDHFVETTGGVSEGNKNSGADVTAAS